MKRPFLDIFSFKINENLQLQIMLGSITSRCLKNGPCSSPSPREGRPETSWESKPKITPNLRYAENVIRNADCEAICQYPVNGYHT